MAFKFTRPVHLYETDLMGVVHHSNYIRYMEEARFAWLRAENLIHLHGTGSDCVFAVLDLQCSYKSPLRWGDSFEVELQVVQMRSRFRFDATIRRVGDGNSVVSQGVVVLACVNNKMQPIKPPGELLAFFQREAQIKSE
jgi:acyl-CoA thioester hydrolase